MSKHISNNVGKSGKIRPNTTNHTWLLKIKCYNNNVLLGLKTLIMVSLWPGMFGSAEFLSEPKNQEFQWRCGAVIMI